MLKASGKVKVIPRQAEVAIGVPGRLRPQIISTFGTTNATAAFTQENSLVLIFRG
jgi:hypothetical protein